MGGFYRGGAVRRFRTLGQIQRKVKTEPLPAVELSGNRPVSNSVVLDSKSIVKVKNAGEKHQYPLRVIKVLWGRVFDLNLNCKGIDSSGPSLNETLCDLIAAALDDEDIVKRIMSKYPDRDQLVIVRSWERG